MVVRLGCRTVGDVERLEANTFSHLLLCHGPAVTGQSLVMCSSRDKSVLSLLVKATCPDDLIGYVTLRKYGTNGPGGGTRNLAKSTKANAPFSTGECLIFVINRLLPYTVTHCIVGVARHRAQEVHSLSTGTLSTTTRKRLCV